MRRSFVDYFPKVLFSLRMRLEPTFSWSFPMLNHGGLLPLGTSIGGDICTFVMTKIRSAADAGCTFCLHVELLASYLLKITTLHHFFRPGLSIYK